MLVGLVDYINKFVIKLINTTLRVYREMLSHYNTEIIVNKKIKFKPLYIIWLNSDGKRDRKNSDSLMHRKFSFG